MKFSFRFLLVLFAFACAGVAVNAQETGLAKDGLKVSLELARQLMKQIDKDGNGSFERTEDAAAWKKYRKLDANRDQVVTLDELRDRSGKYLKTSGQRKLELVYKTVGKKQLKLDLYYPTGNQAEKCPVVVFTHGGGWAAGSRYKAATGSFAEVFGQLIKQGFAVAPVSYRLARRDSGIGIRECVIDCKDALRYLAVNSEELKLDRERFCVMGDSAGGHLAQMLLLGSPQQLTGDESLSEASYQMLAGVSWYGPCDFERIDLFNHDGRADFRDRFGPRIMQSETGPAEKLARYREVSPVNLLTKQSPPLLMIQGDQDTTIPVAHAHYMNEKALEIEAPVEIMIVKNAGHNWRKVGADIEPTREKIVERTVQFFVDQLKK